MAFPVEEGLKQVIALPDRDADYEFLWPFQ